MKKIEKIIPYKINQDFYFCQGHIGISDFKPYLNEIPKIDINYCSLPKPETFALWYKLASKKRISHEQFFAGLIEIWKKIDADEYHIEVGQSNKQQVLDFFKHWDNFSYYYEREIWYSAPLNGKTSGMAKCRNSTQILVFSKKSMTTPDITEVKYSHEYVEYILKHSKHPKKLKCFDPVIGKGLLARSALKNGYSCYGIDMNPNRLKCTYEYIENSLRIKN